MIDLITGGSQTGHEIDDGIERYWMAEGLCCVNLAFPITSAYGARSGGVVCHVTKERVIVAGPRETDTHTGRGCRSGRALSRCSCVTEDSRPPDR